MTNKTIREGIGYLLTNNASVLRKVIANSKEELSRLEENAAIVDRLRKLIPTCDCSDPSQCFEPCGRLGHDEKYAKAVE